MGGWKRFLLPNLGWPLEPSTSALLYFRKAPLTKNHFIELVSCLVGKFIWQTHATGVEALRNTSNKWISATFILIFPLILLRKFLKIHTANLRKFYILTCVCCVLGHSPVPDSLQPYGLYVAHQVPLFMGFSREEYWSGLPFLSPGDLPDPRIKPMSLMSPPLADGSSLVKPIEW